MELTLFFKRKSSFNLFYLDASDEGGASKLLQKNKAMLMQNNVKHAKQCD